MNNKSNLYEAPLCEVVEIMPLGVIAASGDYGVAGAAGAEAEKNNYMNQSF